MRGKTKKTILIFLLLSLNMRNLTAQNPIILRGYVKESSGAALPFVNIFTQQSDTSPIIAFAATNDKGHFSLVTPRPKRLVVNATLLGFQTLPLIFAETDKIPDTLIFTLIPRDFVLKEAIVRGKIIEKSDTTTFKADVFRDSTERNLEELLTKLPGVSVDKNTGSISVFGNPIKKILIEGDDLTGRNYQLMSKNLAADVVDKIQIINRFNENKLLKGLRSNDALVINITLKEERKKLLFGNIIVGLGTDGRTNNSLNLLGFYKKLKTITFGNYNTVGQISTADMMSGQDFKEENPAQQQRAIVNEQSSTFINSNRTTFVNLGSQNIRFNNAALGATFFVIRPRENISVKGGVTVSQDPNRVFTDNSIRYLLRDSIFELNETNTFLRKPFIFESKLDIQVDVSPKSSMRYSGLYRVNTLNNTNMTVSNRNNIVSNLMDKNAYFSNTLDFTYRIDDNKALSINAFYSREKSNQDFDIQQSLRRFIPSVKNPFDSFKQIIEKPMTFTTANSQLFYANDDRKISVGVGAVCRSENLISTFYGIDNTPNSVLFSADSFKNNFNLTQNNFYAHLNWDEYWRGVQLFGDVSGGYLRTNARNETSKNGGYILPTCGFRKATEQFKLFGTYVFNVNMPQLTDLTTGLILTDYRNFQRGSSFFIPANSHTIIGNYVYGKLTDKFMVHANLLASRMGKGYRNDVIIDNDFNSNSKTTNEFSNNSLVFSASGECYFSKIYARLKIKPMISLTEYQNKLNNSDIRQTNITASSIDLSLRSGFLKWFNYHIGATFTQTKAAIKSSINKNTLTNKTIGSFADFYFTLSPRLKMQGNVEYFYFKQAASTPYSYYFVNASLGYEIIRSRLNLTLSGRNLLNTKEFIHSNISDNSTTINKVNLIPRFILIELNLRF